MTDKEITIIGQVAIVIFLIAITLTFLMLLGMWKIFGKAGRRRWLAFVPLQNTWALYKLAGKPGWWSILSLFPVAGWVVSIFMSKALAIKFSKGARFTVLMVLVPPIAYAILGFGKAEYQMEVES